MLAALAALALFSRMIDWRIEASRAVVSIGLERHPGPPRADVEMGKGRKSTLRFLSFAFFFVLPLLTFMVRGLTFLLNACDFFLRAEEGVFLRVQGT